jgi:predicted small lipoprotein YifL
MIASRPHAAPFARRPAAAFAVAALLLGLAGCGRDAGPADAALPPDDGATALPEGFEGVWQGVLPCTDCAGLDVELALERPPGDAARFRLAERYLGGAGEADFASEGTWREEPCRLDGEPGRCIVLLDAGQRWFRHEDGSLQAVDADGRPLDPDGARLLRR